MEAVLDEVLATLNSPKLYRYLIKPFGHSNIRLLIPKFKLWKCSIHGKTWFNVDCIIFNYSYIPMHQKVEKFDYSKIRRLGRMTRTPILYFLGEKEGGAEKI